MTQLELAPVFRTHVENLFHFFQPHHPLIEPIVKGQVDRQNLVVGNQPAEFWVAEVIGLIGGRGEETEAFLKSAARLTAEQQFSFIIHVYDLGWKKSGRRDAIPHLVSELILRHEGPTFHKPFTMLTKLRRELKQRVREHDEIARQLLNYIPKEVRIPDYKGDLNFLGIK